MFFRARECSQSLRRRSSVMVLRMSISLLSWASVWTWVTHRLLVSSVMLLIWIWTMLMCWKTFSQWRCLKCFSWLQLTCMSCIFSRWKLMSLLKVWLTAPTVQLTSSRLSLSLLSCPEVSLEEMVFTDYGSSTFLTEVFPVLPMFTLAEHLGCGARWRFETPLKSSWIRSSQRSCSERTACHPAVPGTPQTGGSVPEGSSAPTQGPVEETKTNISISIAWC